MEIYSIDHIQAVFSHMMSSLLGWDCRVRYLLFSLTSYGLAWSTMSGRVSINAPPEWGSYCFELGLNWGVLNHYGNLPWRGGQKQNARRNITKKSNNNIPVWSVSAKQSSSSASCGWWAKNWLRTNSSSIIGFLLQIADKLAQQFYRHKNY